MGTFDVYTNDFLKFEVGPSMDFQLQWATYRDASDQTSLSRIWGGIHPPIDDIPGRIIGEKIGVAAFSFAEQYFSKEELLIESKVYPNPTSDFVNLQYPSNNEEFNVNIFDLNGRMILSQPLRFNNLNRARIDISGFSKGIYVLYLIDTNNREVAMHKILKN